MILSIMKHNSLDEVKITLVYDTRERRNAAFVNVAIEKALIESHTKFIDTFVDDTSHSWYIHATSAFEYQLDYWYDFVVEALNEVIDYWEYEIDFKASLDCMQVYSLDL